MDGLLVPFYRQYLQQVQTLTLPPASLLVQDDIQWQLYRYFFDPTLPNLPPQAMQIQLLKRLTAAVVNAIEDPNEEELYEPLITRLCDLQALPKASEVEVAQQTSVISYFPPDPNPSTKPVLIQESNNVIGSGPNVGLRTWEACLRLAYHLYLHPEKIRGKRVLELGAGTGLLSIFCGGTHLKASTVLSTDGLSHVVDGLRANLDLNKSEGFLASDESKDRSQGHHEIMVAELDWRWSQAQLREVLLDADDNATAFDVVLGADITYAPDALGPLVDLLDILETQFCSHNPEIIISATVRNPETLAEFEKQCAEANLSLTDLDQEDIPVDMRSQTGFFHEIFFPIRLMRISRSK